jgi:hypothetical protein
MLLAIGGHENHNMAAETLSKYTMTKISHA